MAGSNRLCHGGLFAAPSGLSEVEDSELGGAGQQPVKDQFAKLGVVAWSQYMCQLMPSNFKAVSATAENFSVCFSALDA